MRKVRAKQENTRTDRREGIHMAKKKVAAKKVAAKKPAAKAKKK
jgi:hypothetical protein